MSQPNGEALQRPLNQLQTNRNQVGPFAEQPALSSMIIEITEKKKTKEVIELDNSGESEVPPPKPLKVKQRKQPHESRKPKRTALRCMLCKQPGKKTSMKACIDCKTFFHIACLEQEGEMSSRYRCRKCKHKRDQGGIVVKKGQKGEKVIQQKMAGRRLQKEKRRQQHQKKMCQFQERYPYYFQEDKIKFPIEDKLLFIYRELFEINQTPKLKPTPHPIIPSILLGDLLQIQNFFSTFKEQLIAYGSLAGEIKKDMLYLSMGSKGYDPVFSSMLEVLMKIYLSDIFDKNKTDNVRLLNQHPFFTLLTHLNDNSQLNQEVVVKSAQQILRYLATIPSMKRAFEQLKYPQSITLFGKIDLIVNLIKGLSQIDEFHQLVSIKSQKMQQLTKEKTQLVAQLKVDEAQNLSNNQKLKDMNLAGLSMQQSQEGVTRLLTKQLDKHKKKMQKLASQQTKSEETIKQIRSKISEIGRAMPFLTSQMLFLGLDRNNSQYFFYIRQPNRLYVKFRGYLLDKNDHFSIYQGKQVITQMLKSLNTKGLLEKHLSQNISSLIKDEIIHNIIQNQDANNIMLEQDKHYQVNIQDIIAMVKQIEQTFTTYLSLKHFQWSAPAVRQIFMAQFSQITDLHILKEQMRSLQQNFLFAQYASPSLSKKDEFSDQENNRELQVKQGRKKIPIRIWGINSEKTKKYWIEYLEDCVDVVGIWLCTYIFKNNVEKYVKKKMEAYYEQQIKQQKYRSRVGKERGRPPLIKYSEKIEREKREKTQKRYEPVSQSSQQEVAQEDVEQGENRRPNLRKRKVKKMNIESDIDMENEIEDDQDLEGQSSNEDCCEICQQYGEMICCDTCPKVYHKDCLKIKDIPQGEWSCFKCLERMTHERQTRSKVKKMSKFV